MKIVITQPTLQTLLQEDWPDLEDLSKVPDALTGDITSTSLHESIFFYSRSDTVSIPLVILPNLDSRLITAASARPLWQRVSTFALLASGTKVEVPRSWNPYRSKNMVAFAAVPWNFGSLRWSVEFNATPQSDIIFWILEPAGRITDLSAFRPPLDDAISLRDKWSVGRSDIEYPANAEPNPALSASIDLEEATYGAVTGGSSYSDWLPRLTERQKEFVQSPSAPSVKLRGPAGSGKTLTLQLKLLKELYEGRNAGLLERRYLFVSHSWSVAEQAAEALTLLDESGSLTEVDAFPLLTIAEELLGQSVSGFTVLGDDSLSGRLQQLELIDQIVQEASEGAWIAFEDRASRSIKASMEAPHGSPERNRLNWDLMLEFNTVLAAHGILPSVAAREQYRAVIRGAWMMPIQSETDRDFVLLVYTRLLEALGERRNLTTDQVIGDLLNYLSTFAWNIRRRSEGYDQIFVDELHLFTDQERLALQLLSRDPADYPVLFMALDPRQSPAELYTNVDASQVSSGTDRRLERRLGEIKWVELTEIHRFSSQVLALVRHINNSFPTMDLGDEWKLDLTHVSSGAADGPIPRLIISPSLQAQRRAIELVLTKHSGGRVAIVVADSADLYDYVGYVQLPANVRLVVIDSRDSVENLRYAKKAVVLGSAEYVAGLQFETVIVVAGEVSAAGLRGTDAHRLRRQISSLYLSVTRASREVVVCTITESGPLPPILESAVSAGLLKEGAR